MFDFNDVESCLSGSEEFDLQVFQFLNYEWFISSTMAVSHLLGNINQMQAKSFSTASLASKFSSLTDIAPFQSQV